MRRQIAMLISNINRKGLVFKYGFFKITNHLSVKPNEIVELKGEMDGEKYLGTGCWARTAFMRIRNGQK